MLIRPGAALIVLLIGAATGPVPAAGLDKAPDTPRFEQVRGSDDLRDPRIMDVAQDSRGFMWFATFSGLVRYDGFDFRWFVNAPNDGFSLSDNRIRGLLADSKGALWVSTWDAGLNRFIPQSGRFNRYRHDPQNPGSLDDDRIRALYEDRKGFLWVGTMSGLNRLDPRTGEVRRYAQLTTNTGSSSPVYAITEDAQENLWLSVYGWGLIHLSPDGRVLSRYRHHPSDARSLSDNNIVQLTFDDSGRLWIGTWGGGLNVFDSETGSFRAYRTNPADPKSIPDDQLLKSWVDEHGVWVIPLNGPLARLDTATGRFIRYPHDPARVGSPNPNLSGGAFTDRDGSLWLGTYGAGVSVWHREKPRLTHYQATPGAPGGLSHNLVQSVLQDHNGVIWLGTRHGLNQLDERTGRVTVFEHSPSNPKSLAADYVGALYESRDGELWVGTWGGGLNRLDRQTGTFQRYRCGTSDPRAIGNCDVWSIYEDRAGRLWVGPFDGLTRLDRPGQRLTRYTSRPGDSSSLTSASIYVITETPDGTLWVGTSRGFNRWVAETGAFVQYRSDPSNPNGTVLGSVTAILARPDGALWLGTSSGLQLVEWDGARKPRYTMYAERVGLPRFSVRGLLDDGSDGLWITTFGYGLWHFDPVSGRVAHFDATDGLPRGFDNKGAMMADGRLLLGGIDGAVIFDPSPPAKSKSPPPIAITVVAVDNRPVEAIDTLESPTPGNEPAVTLNAQNRTVSFRFAALDYVAPERNRYRYRLEGYEDSWTETGGQQRQATYTNLKPGTYFFHAVGADSSGVWNDTAAVIRLTVLPAWWQTTWFAALAAVAIAGLLLAGHHLRLRYVVNANRRLVEEIEQRRQAERHIRELAGRLITAQEDERSIIARDLHDDVGQRVASFSIGISRVKRQVPAVADGAVEALSGLQEQVKVLSADLRRISHELHPSMLEHLGLLRSLRTRCQEFGAETGLAVQFNVADTWPEVTAAAALCLFRVAQEALRNVARHANATRVTVSLDRQDDQLIMTVADDGAGFDPSTSRGLAGLGLVSMRERARTLGGTLGLVTAPGAGTIVSVHLPLGESIAAQSPAR